MNSIFNLFGKSFSGTLVLLCFLAFICGPNLSNAQNIDLLQGKKKMEIPFSYYHNFIVLEVRLFGVLPMQFIYDTGAEHVVLFKREFTDIMNVTYDRRIPLLGADLSTKVFALVARNVNLQIEDLPMVEKDILVLENDFFKLDQVTGSKIDGIIGGEFFKNLVIHINYRKQKLIIYNPIHFQAPGKQYDQIKINTKANKPYIFTDVHLQNGSTHNLELLLDTGSGIPLLIHNNTSDGLGLPNEYITGNLGIGIGGKIEGYVGRIESFDFGRESFQNVLTNFQDVTMKISIDDNKFRNGLIGNEILSRFHVYIDYMNEMLYLKPNKKFKRKFNMDRSGLVIFATGRNLNVYVIQEVIAGSPADESDFRQGDIIKSMQGVPSQLISLESILRKMQRKAGKKIRFQIIRDGKILKKTFLLRELI